MSNQTVVLILGLAVIAVVGLLLWRTISARGSGTWKISVGDLFKSELQLSPAQQSEMEAELKRANEARGPSAPVSPAPKLPNALPLRRILWVDDNPDGNVYETLALERLGLPVTKATSSRAAWQYLGAEQYGLVITDLGRPNDSVAGAVFLEQTKTRFPKIPIVVYTLAPDIPTAELVAAGASFVTETPGRLLSAVVTTLSTAKD
ncbi:response regulator [Spongisporangium articulatum]|uniref:Response regulator n=1 Tax=Spongisporangium articulatum TaxID=3362603 RepID=A0ABW8ANF7_9ACTN